MKKIQHDILSLGSVLLAMVLLPIIGTAIHFKGNIPETFYQFPPLAPDYKAPFNWIVFLIIALACLFIVLLYIFPQWFGFKKIQVPKAVKISESIKFPKWFWFGTFIFVLALSFLWSKASGPKFIVNWLLIPLFWGIIFIVDGFVFVRTRGKSLISTKPHTMLAISICSMGGWVFFEFLNFFVCKNWIYPAGNLISNEQFVIYSILGSSALLTVVFEWYMLLKTFNSLALKYTQGPQVRITKNIWKIVLFISLVSLLIIPFFPNQLFFLIWLVPLTGILAILSIRNKWTPLKPIENGNWAPIALICLSYLIQGILYECWNYFGAYHLADGSLQTFNPGYWVYSIPYVERFHVFEMPLLGLFGYLPFGLYCWSAWLIFANILGLDPKIDNEFELIEE